MDVPAVMLPSIKSTDLPVGPLRPHIVGTESHPFIGQPGAGRRCSGVLGTRGGPVCDKLRCEPIHEGHLNWCSVCDIEIKTMAFKNTGACSEIHRKQRDGEPLNRFRLVAVNP